MYSHEVIFVVNVRQEKMFDQILDDVKQVIGARGYIVDLGTMTRRTAPLYPKSKTHTRGIFGYLHIKPSFPYFMSPRQIKEITQVLNKYFSDIDEVIKYLVLEEN